MGRKCIALISILGLFLGLAYGCIQNPPSSVTITIENKSTEALIIDTQLNSVIEMPKGTKDEVRVKPNSWIIAMGKDSGNKHGQRVFVVDGELWTLY